MALKIYDHSTNYTAQVIKLPVKQTVQGLDNLVEVNVFGNSCLVGKDSPEDELYLFFPAGTQLSAEFLLWNNLYRENQMNADQSKKGFFEVNGRVKAIKFRGIISSGFVIPVKSLDKIVPDIWNLSIGDQFNEINGVEVCRKYIVATPSQPGAKGDKVTKINNKLIDLMVPNQFRFHNETSHLGNNLHRLNVDDIVAITDKWHGSSVILSKVLINKSLSLWQKLLNKLGGKVPTKEYGYIYSSGKPKSNLPKGIEGSWINDGVDYYTSNIWKRAFHDYKNAIEDGISVYGELVGYTEGGSFIQKGYDYGCKIQPATGSTSINDDGSFSTSFCGYGEYKMIVYRITYTKPTGEVIEFSWQQVKDYCTKYGLEHAKEFYFGSLREWMTHNSFKEYSDNDIFQDFFEALQQSYNLEKRCIHCSTGVPAEGLVLRIDGKEQYNAFKLKSKLFLKKESDDLDKGETNIEDNQ
jgi:hypothetical protein